MQNRGLKLRSLSRSVVVVAEKSFSTVGRTVELRASILATGFLGTLSTYWVSIQISNGSTL